MSHRIDLFCEDLWQKLTIIESGLQGLKAKVEANEAHAERDVRNHLDRVRIPGDTGMERSRNAFRRAVYTLHVLQQAMPRFRAGWRTKPTGPMNHIAQM
jgi:hypothetical protein